MAQKNYLDRDSLQEFLNKVKEHFAPISALTFKGTVADIAHLPVLADQKAGWMYNVTTGGSTGADDSNFIEGAGHILRDGSNVVAVNVGTEAEPEFKWDILPGVFKIEDRLQFGFEMPADPEDGQTFLYLGETVSNYEQVEDFDIGNPPMLVRSIVEIEDDDMPDDWTIKGLYPNKIRYSFDDHIVEGKSYYICDVDEAEPVSNPKEENLYEAYNIESPWGELTNGYIKSNDETIDPDKEYYKAYPNEYIFRSSVNSYVGSLHTYFTREDGFNEYVPSSDYKVDIGKDYALVYYEIDDSPTPPLSGYIDSSSGVAHLIQCADTVVDPSKTYAKLVNIVPSGLSRGDNPAELGWYETPDGTTFVPTTDTYIPIEMPGFNTKPYFTKSAESFVEGVIYRYDASTETWNPKTSGDVYSRITEAEIDAMFDII